MPEDVPPGTYRTIGYTTDCYWTRLRGFERGLHDLITGNIGSGYQVVTIGRRDAGLDSVSCGTWTSDLSAVLESPTEFEQGTYIVGTDVEPGTYQASSGELCSWLRLAGFRFSRRDIIERGFVRRGVPPTVRIESGDAGFSSSGCGTWRQTTS